MPEPSIIVCGLPASGKTTFLAALWHLVDASDVPTRLRNRTRDFPDYSYVNRISRTWEDGQRQERTEFGKALIASIDLTNDAGDILKLIFPDHNGEVFAGIWKSRSCPKEVAERFSARSAMLLFVNANILKAPRPLMDDIADAREMNANLEPVGVEPVAPQLARDWDPDEAPDQVKLVDLLQATRRSPLMGHDRKIVVFVSAWDVVENDGHSPETFVETQLPLLHQYLKYGDHGWDVRIYGLSAQGCEYVKDTHSGPLPAELQEVLNLPTPSKRIKLVYGGELSHDLTEPLAWLME